MRYLNVFYGVITAFTLLLLADGFASSINTSTADVAICITFGAVITCTLYIVEAIENLRKDLIVIKSQQKTASKFIGLYHE
jgi:hypothetical protein